jgi:hypothetical protein
MVAMQTIILDRMVTQGLDVVARTTILALGRGKMLRGRRTPRGKFRHPFPQTAGEKSDTEKDKEKSRHAMDPFVGEGELYHKTP